MGKAEVCGPTAHDAFWGPHRLNQGYTAQQAGTRIHQQLSGEELGLGQARVLLLASSQSFRENPLGLGRGRLWGPVNSTFLCSAEENGNASSVFSPTLFVVSKWEQLCAAFSLSP